MRIIPCAVLLALLAAAIPAGAQQAAATSAASKSGEQPAATSAASGAAAQPAATSAASGQGSPQAAPSAARPAAKVEWKNIIHRVDSFVTRDDLRAGLTLSDKDAPLVSFSHTRHMRAGVACEQCHHQGIKDHKAPACAQCHKGAPAVEVMHDACITCHRQGARGPVSCNDCHTQRQNSLAGFVRFDLEDIVRGPLFIAAWALFALGFAWRVVQYLRLTRKGTGAAIALAPPVRPDEPALLAGRSLPGRLLLRYRRWLRGSIFGTHRVMARVSMVFHVVLFLLPLLLPAHNILFFQTFRVALPTLPEGFMDVMTLLMFAFGAFFLLRRIFIPRVRALTTVRDYLVLLLVAAPFVSAYMAYHHWLDYRTVLSAHMLIGDLVIALVPFTKLGHMPFLLLNRFFTAGEYAWKPGNRRW
jgi:nitrate reductase gamma subunit